MKEITYEKDLPSICLEKKKIVQGSVVESEYINVKGKNLAECKKYIDKLK